MSAGARRPIAIRFVKSWDIVPDLHPTRFDARFNSEGEIVMDGEREQAQTKGREADGCAVGVEGYSGSIQERRAHEVALLIESMKEERRQDVTLENVEDVFAYHSWSPDQKACGDCVREALIVGVRAILRSVPPGALRRRAIDCLIDARMIANASITFRGRF